MPLISGVTGSPTNTQTGGDEVYQWNGNGTITFSIGGTVQYLIVGGGGGGGGGNFGNCGGGGGAGGLLAGTFTVSDSTYTINVGAGGIAGVFPDGTPSYDEGQGGNGGDSSIVGLNSPAVAIGGGGGGRGLDFATLSFNNGLDGGSGGGEGSGQASATAGLGTTGQGNNGGDSSTFNSGGGGGGASAVGGAGDTATEGGAGGNGTASEITGTSITYAGGGGGGGSLTNTGLGGTGGGGNGHDGTSTPTAGTDGLGGGGGGGRNTAGADGGDGIVIIRFTPETNNIAVISENTIAQNATPTVNGGLPYTGVEDHTIEEGAPAAIDIDPSFLAIYQSTTEHKRALLRATGLSNIPANAIITSATLYLNRSFSNTGDRVIDARRCLQTWDHEDCSWNRFDASLGSPAGDWGTAGADSDGVDRIATATDTVTHSDSDSGYGVATFDLTSDVQSIIDGTISSNEGWLFSTDNIASAGNFGIYISSTGTNFQRPELVVEYSLPPSGSGIKTIGTNGDFATISDWADAVKGENILSENAEGRLTDDKIYDYGNTEDLAFFDAGLNLNGFTVTLRGFGSGIHDSSFGTGARIEASAPFGGLYRAQQCIIEDFSLTNTETTLGGARCLVQSTATVRRTIARTLSTGSNCDVLEFASGGPEACYTEGGTTGIDTTADGVSIVNCTVVDADTGINGASNTNLTVQNNVVYNCTTEYAGTFSTSTVSHNAGEDAVGTQPTEIQTDYVQITSADFVDAVGGDYRPVRNLLLDNTGTTTTATTDLVGEPVDERPPIGAFENDSGIKDIGTTGSFSTIANWSAYVKGLSTLTRNEEGRLVDNAEYAHGGETDLKFDAITLNGFTITLKGFGNGVHDGTVSNGARVRLIEPAVNDDVLYQVQNIIIEDFIGITTNNDFNNHVFASYGNATFNRVIGEVEQTPGGGSCWYQVSGTGITCNSCLAIGGFHNYNIRNGVASLINCTGVNASNHGLTSDGSYAHTIQNVVIYNSGSDDFRNGFFTLGTVSNNASEDTTAPGTNSVTGITSAVFVDYAGGDYSPTNGGELDGAGTSTSVTTGVNQKLFNSPPSIGAFAAVPLFTATQVQTKTSNISGAAPSASPLTFDLTATSGNLLVSVITTSDNGQSPWTAPTGWTLGAERAVPPSLDQASIAIAYKISDGTETGLTWTEDSAPQVGPHDVWFAEYSGITGSTPHVPVVTSDSNFTGTDSLATATTSATTADYTLAIAAWCKDNGTHTQGTFSNDFESEYVDLTNDASIWVAKRDVYGAKTLDTTLSGVGTDGEMASVLLVWEVDSGGATSYSINAETGALILAGQDAFLRKQFIALAESGAIALDGQDASIFKGYNVISDPGALTIDGQDAITRKGYNVVSDTGSLLIDGQDATTRKGYNVISDTGSLLIDGQDIVGRRGYSVLSDPGALTIDGQDATTRKDFVSLSDPGALTIDGQDAITRKGYNVISNAGSLLIDGQDAGTRKGYNVVAEATTITIAGQDSGLTKVYSLNAEDSTITVGGQNATLRKSYNLVVDEIPILINGLDANLLLGSQTAILAETGSFFVNGQDAVLRVTRTINAEATILDIEGQDAVTRRGYNVVSDPGSLTIDGQDATTRKGYNIISESGNITNAGQDSILRKGYVHISESGSLFVAGQSTNLAYGRVFSAESGSIVLTGQDANLNIIAGLRLTADPGAVQVIGKEVQLGETTGNRLLRYSTLASGATALQHFLNINFGTGGGQIEIIETDRIHATVSEDVIVAEISEDIIQATIVENVITAIVSEDTLDSTIEEDTIQGSLTE